MDFDKTVNNHAEVCARISMSWQNFNQMLTLILILSPNSNTMLKILLIKTST